MKQVIDCQHGNSIRQDIRIGVTVKQQLVDRQANADVARNFQANC
jgi:ferredoxin-fold anticodon binding domain-containing protein